MAWVNHRQLLMSENTKFKFEISYWLHLQIEASPLIVIFFNIHNKYHGNITNITDIKNITPITDITNKSSTWLNVLWACPWLVILYLVMSLIQCKRVRLVFKWKTTAAAMPPGHILLKIEHCFISYFTMCMNGCRSHIVIKMLRRKINPWFFMKFWQLIVILSLVTRTF